MRRIKKWVALIGSMGVLAGCVSIVDSRGHSTDEADFKQVIIGQSREDDVAAILGTPSTRSTYGDNSWYYISEKIETVGMLPPAVTDQQIVAVRFDANHVVTAIDHYTIADAKNVQNVSKTTPTEGHDFSVMEQLFGNFGRFATPGRNVSPRDLGH